MRHHLNEHFLFLGDKRTYSYVAALSTKDAPNWNDLMFLAKLITKILHNINRVCYVFNGIVVHPITDITPTRICKYAISQVRMADHIATEVMVFFLYFHLIIIFY